MKARVIEYRLKFKRPAGTSRGILTDRPVWYLILEKEDKRGIGEAAPLPGLSSESIDDVKRKLSALAANRDDLYDQAYLTKMPSSVRFAAETAMRDMENGGHQILFPSKFTQGRKGIPANGLIWMGDAGFMTEQIRRKLDQGCRCIKLKIGSLQFAEELRILQNIRSEYSENDIILRVDANGAFTPEVARERLDQLAELQIDSIEQPIATGQWQEMAGLCSSSPVDIALDEELIGITRRSEKIRLLETLRPHYLVLKPSLHGGIHSCDEWIELAEERGTGWWITSYLESNLGLNAISQWAYIKNLNRHQGLGTGGLFTNNIHSPLELRGEELFFDPHRNFVFPGSFRL